MTKDKQGEFMTKDELDKRLRILIDDTANDFPNVASILCTLGATVCMNNTSSLSEITAKFSEQELDKIKGGNTNG